MFAMLIEDIISISISISICHLFIDLLIYSLTGGLVMMVFVCMKWNPGCLDILVLFCSVLFGSV